MKIIAFKLISGEEIIGKFDASLQQDNETIVLEDPHALVMMQTPKGMRGTFLDYVQSFPSIAALKFPKAHMLVEPFEVHPEVASAYQSATSSIDLSATNAASTLIKP